jgi:hypothetical protein
MPLAEEQALQPHLTPLLAITASEGMVDLAAWQARLAAGVLDRDLSPGHREYLPVGRA